MFEKPTDTGDAVDARLRVRVPVKAGPRTVTVAFVQRPGGRGFRSPPGIRAQLGRQFRLGGTPAHADAGDHRTLQGHRARRHAEPPPHLRLPTALAPNAERALRQGDSSTLARRAYRRPVTDADLQPVLSFYDSAGAKATSSRHRDGASSAFSSARSSCSASKRDPAGAAPGSVYRISDLELASRLSFFLWSSIPDDELLTTGRVQGKLKRSGGARTAGAPDARRSASKALVSNFAGQWLHLRNLRDASSRTPTSFPISTTTCAQAFERETELFFESIMREDRSVLDLLTRRLHLRERTPGAALRHLRTSTAAISGG